MYVVVVCIRGGRYGDCVRSSVVMVFVVEDRRRRGSRSSSSCSTSIGSIERYLRT